MDVVSGASLSSEAILTAVEDCVVQAGGDYWLEPLLMNPARPLTG